MASRSLAETVSVGTFAMRLTTVSTSSTVTAWVRFSSSRIRSTAPASSITSIAESGRCRSTRCFWASLAAASRASSAYFTPWCSS